MRTRQKRVATDTWRSLGCRTTPLKHWSRRKPTVEPRWAKQRTKKLRPQPTKINSFMSGPSLSLTPVYKCGHNVQFVEFVTVLDFSLNMTSITLLSGPNDCFFLSFVELQVTRTSTYSNVVCPYFSLYLSMMVRLTLTLTQP